MPDQDPQLFFSLSGACFRCFSTGQLVGQQGPSGDCVGPLTWDAKSPSSRWDISLQIPMDDGCISKV